MLAVDSNAVVRFAVIDDHVQAAKARRLIEEEDVFICHTVLLESDWVLRSVYGYSSAQVGDFVRALAGLPSVTVENPEALTRALDRVRNGLDLTDSLHLAQTEDCNAFVTFDRSLARAARKLTTLPVRAP